MRRPWIAVARHHHDCYTRCQSLPPAITVVLGRSLRCLASTQRDLRPTSATPLESCALVWPQHRSIIPEEISMAAERFTARERVPAVGIRPAVFVDELLRDAIDGGGASSFHFLLDPSVQWNSPLISDAEVSALLDQPIRSLLLRRRTVSVLRRASQQIAGFTVDDRETMEMRDLGPNCNVHDAEFRAFLQRLRPRSAAFRAALDDAARAVQLCAVMSLRYDHHLSEPSERCEVRWPDIQFSPEFHKRNLDALFANASHSRIANDDVSLLQDAHADLITLAASNDDDTMLQYLHRFPQARRRSVARILLQLLDSVQLQLPDDVGPTQHVAEAQMQIDEWLYNIASRC